MSFDEEFLRQAFYQTLHPPYLTNTGGNARADVLDIVRPVAALRPEAIMRAARGRWTAVIPPRRVGACQRHRP